jgi:hypothetical protein
VFALPAPLCPRAQAIKQQEEEMAAAHRAALLQQHASGSGPDAAPGMPGGFGGLPHSIGGLGGDDGGEGGPGGPGEGLLDADEYQRLLASGQVPVLLGEDGRPVYGPRGEPVIVAPDGMPMLISPDGEVAPYMGRPH